MALRKGRGCGAGSLGSPTPDHWEDIPVAHKELDKACKV